MRRLKPRCSSVGSVSGQSRTLRIACARPASVKSWGKDSVNWRAITILKREDKGDDERGNQLYPNNGLRAHASGNDRFRCHYAGKEIMEHSSRGRADDQSTHGR